jgi:hypothetical protein
MSEQNPYEQLGLTEDASFDQIQAARNRLGTEFANDPQQLQRVEAAYDAVLMDRLKLRQEGKIKVPDRIRFAEKLTEATPKAPTAAKPNSPQWLANLRDTPAPADIWAPAGVMSALIALVLLSPLSSIAQTAQLGLLLGMGALFYFLFRKEKKFWRTIVLGFSSLVLGLLLGFGLFSLLQGANLLLPISLEAFACAVTFAVFWLVSSFLK